MPSSTTEIASPLPKKSDVDYWARLANIATALGLLSTGVSAGWALFSYQSELETRRAEKTIEYISLWENEGPQESYRYIHRKWAAFLAEIPAEQIAFAEANAKAKAKLISNFYTASRQDTQWQAAIGKTSYFFNRLGLCVEAKLCSKNVARIFFGDVIRPYVAIFGQYIEENGSEISGSIDVIHRPLE